MSKFAPHDVNLHIGKVVDKVTIIKVTEKEYIAQCSCGVKLRKRIYDQIPQMCKECAKVQHRSNYVPTKDSDQSCSIRPMTKWENMMIKEFKRKQK